MKRSDAMKLALAIVMSLGTSAAAQPGLALLRSQKDVVPDMPVYEIDQAIDDVTGKFSAKLTLRYTNTTGAAVSTIPLLLHPNAARELGAKDTGTIEITNVAGAKTRTKRPTLVEVVLAKPLAAKDKIELVVSYKGELRNLGAQANDAFAQALGSIGSLASSGTSDYGLFGMGDGLVTLASAFPMIAPWREGAFDTTPPSQIGDLAYNHPAAFRVRTVLPPGMTMVSNLVDGAPAKQGANSVVISEGAMVRDFVMVAGRDLKRAEKRVGDVRVASIFREKDVQGGKAALDVAVSSLKTFERRFGPYPYTELDIAEASIVGGAGGVEFCGLVLIAGSLYRDPLDSSSPIAMLLNMMSNLGGQLGGTGKPPTAKIMEPILEFTVAHEVAHQWFAELVGNDSKQHPVVDEPLAQYAAALAIEEFRGAKAAATSMDSSVKMNYALYRLMGGTDQHVLRPTTSYRTQIEYAGLVYGKAPYVYTALRKSLGDKSLDRAIRSAVTERRWKLSTTEDWITSLERGAGGPRSGVRAAFKRWLGEASGDRDLGVDDSGDFVIATMLPPDIAKSVREGIAMLGMKPRDLMKMLFGGGLGGAPSGTGLDPDQALLDLLGP